MSWTTREAVEVWTRLSAIVDEHPRGAFVKFTKQRVPHPRDAGAELSFGLPLGQRADFRFPPAHDCTGLHVHEYDEAWVAHRDAVHPECDPVDHLRNDAPKTFILASAGVGAALGAALGKGSRGAVVAGVGVGLLVAGLALAALDAKRQREQAERQKGFRFTS